MTEQEDLDDLTATVLGMCGWEHPGSAEPCRCCGTFAPRTERGDWLLLCEACAAVVDGTAYWAVPPVIEEVLLSDWADCCLGYKGTEVLSTPMLMCDGWVKTFEEEMRSHMGIPLVCPKCGTGQFIDNKGVCTKCKSTKEK